MNCCGTCFTHVQINCDVTCAQRRNALLRYIPYTLYIRPATRGGVGWGGGVGCNDICTVLAPIFDATQLYLRTCPMLRNCTCAHVGCFAIALAHMFDATQLHLGTCSMLRNCTWAHVRLHLGTCWLTVFKLSVHALQPNVLNSCV